MDAVSIHAPARGATYQWRTLCERLYRFNPRTREGCDQSERQSASCEKFQSTHPRGVRQRLLKTRSPSGCFNPRTREGCDVAPSAPDPAETGFNPRTREGCDSQLHQEQKRLLVSIHAPARGATSRDIHHWLALGFQSTHPRGVRPCSIVEPYTYKVFQSTHPRGVRLEEAMASD